MPVNFLFKAVKVKNVGQITNEIPAMPLPVHYENIPITIRMAILKGENVV